MKSLMPLPKILNRSVAHITAVCKVATLGQPLDTVAKLAQCCRNRRHDVQELTVAVSPCITSCAATSET